MADAAKYRIAKELDVPAEMRDGTTLFADVYRPDAEGKFPVRLDARIDSEDPVGRSGSGRGCRLALQSDHLVTTGHLAEQGAAQKHGSRREGGEL